MKLSKRLLSVFVAFLMFVSNNFIFLTHAEELTSPSPIPEAIVEIENNSTIIDEVESNSNTGQNEIVVTEIVPTIAPTYLASPTSTPITEVITEDALSVVNVENNINSNVANSEFVYHTLNIYLREIGDINLSTLTSNIINKVYGVDNNLSENVSVKVTNIDNFAYIENNILSNASTGNNNIISGENSKINSGDAYSAVSVLNNINTNIIDSKVHLVTVNIFDSLDGDIILPDIQDVSNTCVDCTSKLNLSNNAEVNNKISSLTDTGNNEINFAVSSTATPTAEIITGDAKSATNVLNLVNLNFVDTVFRYLYINTLGNWVGDFLGWEDDLLSEESDMALSTIKSSSENVPCQNCSSGLPNLSNTAVINNSITSSADTGNNQIMSKDTEVKIETGNAYSSVSLINLVNTNVVNSIGFIGFVNIFGTWNGNIGGADFFVKEEETEIDEEDENDSDNDTNVQADEAKKELGGILEVTHTNNVGTHVLPGDTVTFSVKTKNIGSGKVYNSKLSIELLKDGVYYGGADFVLGDIGAQKTIKLTTGLVMSKNAPSGTYVAKIKATGIVGPEDNEVSSISESNFKIISYNRVFAKNIDESINLVPEVQASPEVLGVENSTFSECQLFIFLLILLLIYIIIKKYQKKYCRTLRKSR